MVRPGLLLGDVSLNHPESQAFSASNPRETLNQSSEKLLQGLLLVAVVGLGLRALLAAVLACQHRSTSQVEGKGLEVVPLLFFGKVIINVTLKVLATTSHGLLAVKWILAGEPAGFALVASFVLVAVNTQILVTVVQVGHLRHLLLKLGLTKQARVSFAGVGSLWQVPGGRACVAVNGIATLCLVVHLHQRPWQLLPWLATACGTLVWANASFQGVGVTTWNDLKPIATDDSAVMEAEEFMESLGVAESALPDTACGKWLALVAKMFTVGKENAIMLQNRQVLMHHAFPTNPTFRFFHGVVMVLFNLCCFGVPAALVAVSMMQVPVIHDLQVSGGALYPSLSPQQSHYYVRLNDGWTEGISFTFELDVGKASSFEFCCPFCVELTGSEHGNSLILKSEMPKENLGTCQLNLFGLRFQQYQFTALALQGLEMESRLDTEIGHFEPPFQAGLQTYESSFVSKSSASISLRVVLELDMENTKVAYTARWCTNRACSNELVEGEKEADITKPAQVGCFNLTLWITLSPASSMPNVSSVYEISVTVIDLKMKLDEIAFKMSELQAQMSALEDLDSPTENLKAELERTVLERDMYLEAAYRLEQPEDGFEEMRPDLTFLAVGLTGAGKSELCHWMTGNLDKCSPSNSMQSNTSQVQEVFAYPFDDFKLKPHIKWLDTPGRGDTRGETNDTKMWSQTMSFLVNRSNSEFVDRIVWVINAAWQRATAARQMIFRELRRSFGLHLYRHLDLLFNFLPHVPNKTAYDKEVLWPQRCRFLEWIEEQEIELLNWSNKSVLWHGVRREIHETGFFGVSIHPSYLKKLPSALRLSSPYLDRFHPFSHPASIRELIRLFKDARSKRQRGVQGLQLDNQHPRIGPGKLEQMEAMSYRCGLVPESEDNPSQLVIGVKFVHVKLAGQYFSEGDRAVLLPRQQDCGDPDVQHWAWWAKGIQAPESVQNTSADYWMSCQGQDLQLCFCEAPQCTEAWRFGQSVGASATDSSILPPSVKEQCSKMVEKINTNEVAPSKTGKNHGWGSWARVGDKLFGLPWQVNPVIVLDLNTAKLSTLPTASELKHLDYDLVGLSPSSAVVNECIYSPPFKLGADYMLIVNTTSGKVSTLNHRLYLDGKHIYSAIAAVGTTLYVFPKAGFTQLLSIDVGSAAAYFDQIAIDQELDGCVWPSQESRSWSAAMWYDVAVVDGSLFASPWDAECMLIFHTSNRTFEGIDTTQVARGAAKWSRLLEIRGSIYAAPSNAYYAGSAPSRDILAVDIAQKKARGISVGKCHVGNEWTSMGSHGGYIYILPSRPTNILVLDLQTETTFCFQAGDILGGGGHHFMDTVVANDKLYALPDQEGAILVLDLNIEVTQATENATVATQH